MKPGDFEAREEIGPGVHCIRSVYAEVKPLAVYVLAGDFTLWVDAGIDVTPERHIIPYLTERAPQAWDRPQMAVVTHADVDHFGGLRALRRRRPETLVLAHQADKRWIESPEAILRERYLMHDADGLHVGPQRQQILQERGGGGAKVDLGLQGDEILDLGAGQIWQVLRAPGHSAGHLVLWHAARRWAIIGDAALDWGIQDIQGRLMAPPPYYDCTAYEKTVRMLEALHPEQVLTSHYGVLDQEQAAELFANSLAAMTAIGAAVSDALRAQPEGVALADLCREVGQRSGVRWAEPLWPGLADPISAHLAHAIGRGAVEKLPAADQPRYRQK